MKIFFTSDCHFDHANIIKFCDRPFKNVTHMNEEMIKRWNSVVTSDDLVYHIGDFAWKNQGKKFEDRLNGTIVHIKGNHDSNNGVKTYITHCIMEFGGVIFYVTHIPPIAEQQGTVESNLIDICNVILCGHVHDDWRWAMIRDKYVINVGCDVWNFQPIQILSILKLIGKIKHGVIL